VKVFTSIFLLIAIFSQTFSAYLIQADFSLNRDFIAKVLCVNKEKPAMKCNGKCYLVKKLNEQQNQESPNTVPQNQKFEIQSYIVPHSLTLVRLISKEKTPFFIKDDLTISTLPHSIFHPPIFLS
jgi:hypothetical protein